eukprot:scaffold148101_cov62-Attheya_sp.AAC.2
MDSSPLMPTPNTTPVRCCSDDDDTRKRKSVCTPTRPTPPRNERMTPLNPPQYGPRSFVLPPNPYRLSQPNAFIADTSCASTPQLQRLSAISVTPGSSVKKKRATRVHSTAKSQSNKSSNKFILSTSELYKPFRESILLRMDDPGVVPGAVSHTNAALEGDNVDANVDADIVVQLHANTGTAPAFDYNDFNTKA